MRISASNIAWSKEHDEEMYQFLSDEKIEGLEIAPTRIFAEAPYDKLEEASDFNVWIKQRYDLIIPSMQSIWFGRKENIFYSREERRILLDYTKKAIDFAAVIGCENLVFGCPRNRAFTESSVIKQAIPFFEELGDYAIQKGTILSMEANPPIYNTNYCNTTMEALGLVKAVSSNGFRINLDLGTMIQNGENMHVVESVREWINHVHISEPGLALIEHRTIYKELAQYLRETSYDRFVSLEMKTQDNLQTVKDAIHYIQEVFG